MTASRLDNKHIPTAAAAKASDTKSSAKALDVKLSKELLKKELIGKNDSKEAMACRLMKECEKNEWQKEAGTGVCRYVDQELRYLSTDDSRLFSDLLDIADGTYTKDSEIFGMMRDSIAYQVDQEKIKDIKSGEAFIKKLAQDFILCLEAELKKEDFEKQYKALTAELKASASSKSTPVSHSKSLDKKTQFEEAKKKVESSRIRIFNNVVKNYRAKLIQEDLLSAAPDAKIHISASGSASSSTKEKAKNAEKLIDRDSKEVDAIIAEFIDSKVALKEDAAAARTEMIKALKTRWVMDYNENNLREACHMAAQVLSIRQKYDAVKTPSMWPWGQSSTKKSIMNSLETVMMGALKNQDKNLEAVRSEVLEEVNKRLDNFPGLQDKKTLYSYVFDAAHRLHPAWKSMHPLIQKTLNTGDLKGDDATTVRNEMIALLLDLKQKNPRMPNDEFTEVCRIVQGVLSIRQNYDIEKSESYSSQTTVKKKMMSDIEEAMKTNLNRFHTVNELRDRIGFEIVCVLDELKKMHKSFDKKGDSKDSNEYKKTLYNFMDAAINEINLIYPVILKNFKEQFNDKVKLKDSAIIVRNNMVGRLIAYSAMLSPDEISYGDFANVCKIAQEVLSIRQKYEHEKTKWLNSDKVKAMEAIEAKMIELLSSVRTPDSFGKEMYQKINDELKKIPDKKGTFAGYLENSYKNLFTLCFTFAEQRRQAEAKRVVDLKDSKSPMADSKAPAPAVLASLSSSASAGHAVDVTPVSSKKDDSATSPTPPLKALVVAPVPAADDVLKTVPIDDLKVAMAAATTDAGEKQQQQKSTTGTTASIATTLGGGVTHGARLSPEKDGSVTPPSHSPSPSPSALAAANHDLNTAIAAATAASGVGDSKAAATAASGVGDPNGGDDLDIGSEFGAGIPINSLFLSSVVAPDPVAPPPAVSDAKSTGAVVVIISPTPTRPADALSLGQEAAPLPSPKPANVSVGGSGHSLFSAPATGDSKTATATSSSAANSPLTVSDWHNGGASPAIERQLVGSAPSSRRHSKS